MKKFLILLLFFFSFSNVFAAPEDEQVPSSGRSRWDIIWRSAVIPGWGLLHAGETKKGIFALSTFAIFVGLEIQGHQVLEHRKEKYEQSKDVLDVYLLGFRENADPVTLVTLQGQKEIQHLEYENAAYKSQVKLGLLVLKYVVQLGFANFYGIKWEKGEIGQGLRFDVDKDYVSAPYQGAVSSSSLAQRFSLTYSFVF
ncbi:hypothetical protein [Leptospira saintgironsiae]|uniref:DUF5683 domain-containing protein n=1 Tax=Leptospira saintgironsiae TaxID=2023183 RepID=A0A2M9YDW6_9LEPT|nr:hypothetical protein [Leptospira saintgironsiae]PJZ49755.1 hypothetical protein CH362_05355 [Leptospira saintgironsiae]